MQSTSLEACGNPFVDERVCIQLRPPNSDYNLHQYIRMRTTCMLCAPDWSVPPLTPEDAEGAPS